MKKYFYFGRAKNGALMPVFECVAETDPTPEQRNTIYQEIVRQQGLGVPRPSHYAALEMIEIEQTESGSEEPVLIHSGETVH